MPESKKHVQSTARVATALVAIPGWLLLVTGSMLLPSIPVIAAQCFVSAETLGRARADYARQCSEPRSDCDPVNGQWYCSSETIGPETVFADTMVNNPVSTATANSTEEDTPTRAGENQRDDPVNRQPSSSAENPNAGCVDTDGDGWGWTGTESCRVINRSQPLPNAPQNEFVASSEPSGNSYQPKDITDLVLVTGQSNALGANTAYDARLDAPHSRVFAFTDEGWLKADLNQVWDRGWHPRNDPDTDPSNNFAFHFGKRLTRLRADRVTGFILVTAPGAAIANWDYNSDFYRLLRNKVLDAINQLPHKSTLDGILWHQGETDALDTALYSSKLNALIGNFRSENWFDSGGPFICGEIAMDSGVNNRLNLLNSDGDASTACVPARGLPTSADGAHFTAEALRTLGNRYAEKYIEMTR